ncbi:hypothetical protein GBAR_LOCUS20937 [Geodia barretti]|uniref:Uncharacterized protein n=1 Tax=Geodia barretti TaxID=519541 RepID=A0AA35X459_GEOBA|nr:hypothetical protein GBAR_LOCUS20937 [Geodia barretti]
MQGYVLCWSTLHTGQGSKQSSSSTFGQHLSVDSGCDGEERRCGSIDDDSETLQILNEETEGEKIVASVSILDAYMFQLKTKKAFALCNGSLHAFVLQDFSEETLCLKPLHYHFISRSAKQFRDEVEWVYNCTCDSHASRLSTTLNSTLELNYSEFLKKFP